MDILYFLLYHEFILNLLKMKQVSWLSSMQRHYGDLEKSPRRKFATIFTGIFGPVVMCYMLLIHWIAPHGTHSVGLLFIGCLVVPAGIYFLAGRLAVKCLKKMLKVELAVNLFSISALFFGIAIQWSFMAIYFIDSPDKFLVMIPLIWFMGYIDSENLYYYYETY